eukprot:CAMPEP_0113603410 /NCGR_PEP_ID=MMETSP0017_2-20120614/1263_1 /TAXON_ID=2856 /ORGANISM="Cylindrotheca closterium" /LENGTH=37 /DNA_ID=CAMNT_0000511799 /DNA_START=40 /DNA_END=153 /DNA_ORIENTATION=+ /assembly_acc=CAM_ASM_000147
MMVGGARTKGNMEDETRFVFTATGTQTIGMGVYDKDV